MSATGASASGSGVTVSATTGSGSDFSTAGSAEATASAVSISAIASPTFTVSPSATKYLTTAPSTGLGTSIEALSDSKTTRESSCSTESPTDTHSSITSTDSAPPKSGIVTISIAT